MNAIHLLCKTVRAALRVNDVDARKTSHQHKSNVRHR